MKNITLKQVLEVQKVQDKLRERFISGSLLKKAIKDISERECNAVSIDVVVGQDVYEMACSINYSEEKQVIFFECDMSIDGCIEECYCEILDKDLNVLELYGIDIYEYATDWNIN